MPYKKCLGLNFLTGGKKPHFIWGFIKTSYLLKPDFHAYIKYVNNHH